MAFLATPTAATLASMAGLPFAGVQTSIAIGSIKGPKARLQNLSYEVAEANKLVFENRKHIPVDAHEDFLILMDRFIRLQIMYEKEVNRRGFINKLKVRYGQVKKNGDDLQKIGFQICKSSTSISMMANVKRQICELHHENSPKNSRGQCLVCFPEEISTGLRQDMINLQDPPLTWTAFLRSGEAQEGLNQDPPTYLESADDENHFDSAMEALPREELSHRWHEYCAEFDPWASRSELATA